MSRLPSRERLAPALRSVLGLFDEVVYVDSASSDASVDVAGDCGAAVVRLPADGRLSAARARNAGFQALRSGESDLDVFRPDAGCQAIVAVVGDADGFVESVEADHAGDGTEYLLARDAHVIGDAGEDVAAVRTKLANEYTYNVASPFLAAERGELDGVIEPAATRVAVVKALRALRTKRATQPAKKHGNIPL